MARKKEYAIIVNFGQGRISIESPAPKNLERGWEIFETLSDKRDVLMVIRAHAHLTPVGDIATALLAPPA